MVGIGEEATRGGGRRKSGMKSEIKSEGGVEEERIREGKRNGKRMRGKGGKVQIKYAEKRDREES